MTLQMDLPTADEYPTRKAAEAALLYRKDPAVWGDQNSGPFSDEELRGYDQRGYTQIESLISGEVVQTYSEELKRLGSDSELRKDDRVVVEPTSDEVRSVFEAHKIRDRKSTRLNSSHVAISYAVFCLKKKKKTNNI